MKHTILLTVTLSLLAPGLAFSKTSTNRKVAAISPFGVDGVKQIRMKCDTASYMELDATVGQIATLVKEGYKLVAVVLLDSKEKIGKSYLYEPNTCVYTLVRQ